MQTPPWCLEYWLGGNTIARLAQTFHGSGRRHSGALHQRPRHDGKRVCWRHNDCALLLSWRHDSARVFGRRHDGALPRSALAAPRWCPAAVLGSHWRTALRVAPRCRTALEEAQQWHTCTLAAPRWRTCTVAAPRWRSATGLAPRRRRVVWAVPRCHSAPEIAPRRRTYSSAAPWWYPATEPAPRWRPAVGGGHVGASVPHRIAFLAHGGVLDGWRAGWARPDTGKTHREPRHITTDFTGGSACGQSVPQLPS